MILPGFVTKLYRAVVVFHQLVGIVQASAFDNPLQGTMSGSGSNLSASNSSMFFVTLMCQLCEQLVPVLEIVAGAFKEQRHTARNLVWRDGNRAHVEVAVVDAVVDAVGRWHQRWRVLYWPRHLHGVTPP